MDDKLKIIFAMDSYLPDVDGVVNCVHNYCLNLCDKAEVNLMVPRNKKGYVDNFPYKIHRCKSMHIPILDNYYGFPKLDGRFKKEMCNIDADIIHVHSPFNMASYALKLGKSKSIPVVATFHSNMRPIFRSVVKSKWVAERMVKRLGKLYNKFDEVFVCSPLVEEQLRSFGYTGKVSYLPFGTELERCDNVEENSLKANEIFNIREDELVFLYVGRIMKLKRIDFILDALKIVREKGIRFKFFVVGQGFEIEKLETYSKKLGFTDDKVIFTGFIEREKLSLINARADLLLFPSLYDNFGLVKVEAAAYSTPGLFIKDSCAGYGVTSGVNGYLSDDNIEGFAEKICEAIKDRENLKEVGINASRDLYIHWRDCSEELLIKLKQIVIEKKHENEINSIDKNKKVIKRS